MTERLEEIKNVYEDYKGLQKKRDFKQADIALLYLSENHIDWLVKQAERVEELETQLSINTNNMKHLQNKIERYKQALENITISPIPLEIDDAVNIARQALKGE